MVAKSEEASSVTVVAVLVTVVALVSVLVALVSVLETLMAVLVTVLAALVTVLEALSEAMTVFVALSVEVALAAVDVDAADVDALDADVLGVDALAAVAATETLEALEAAVLAKVALVALVDGDLLGDRDLAAVSALDHNLLGDDDALRDALRVLLVVFEDSVTEKLALGESGLHDVDDLAPVDSGAEDFATEDSGFVLGGSPLDADDLLDADALDQAVSSASAAELLDGDILSDGDDAAPTKGEDDARTGLVPSEARCGRREKS